MEWLVVKRAWQGAAGLGAWRRLFFVALAGMVMAGARVVVDGCFPFPGRHHCSRMSQVVEAEVCAVRSLGGLLEVARDRGGHC